MAWGIDTIQPSGHQQSTLQYSAVTSSAWPGAAWDGSGDPQAVEPHCRGRDSASLSHHPVPSCTARRSHNVWAPFLDVTCEVLYIKQSVPKCCNLNCLDGLTFKSTLQSHSTMHLGYRVSVGEPGYLPPTVFCSLSTVLGIHL